MSSSEYQSEFLVTGTVQAASEDVRKRLTLKNIRLKKSKLQVCFLVLRRRALENAES